MDSNSQSSSSSTAMPCSPLRRGQRGERQSDQEVTAPAPLQVKNQEKKADEAEKKGPYDGPLTWSCLSLPLRLLSPPKSSDTKQDKKEQKNTTASPASTMPQTWSDVKKEIHGSPNTKRASRMGFMAEEYMYEFEAVAGSVLEGFARLASREAREMKRR